MTKTKRKKRINREQKKKTELLKSNVEIFRSAEKNGFKSAQESVLYNKLIDRGVAVRHNVFIEGDEIDLFVPPKTIIEIGFRDEHLLRKWNKFTELGYNFLYFSNIEIHDASILNNTINNILKSLNED